MGRSLSLFHPSTRVLSVRTHLTNNACTMPPCVLPWRLDLTLTQSARHSPLTSFPPGSLHDLQWEKSRDGRVGTWRDFMTKKSKKSKGGSVALGGLKPPKSKTSGARGGRRGGWGGAGIERLWLGAGPNRTCRRGVCAWVCVLPRT